MIGISKFKYIQTILSTKVTDYAVTTEHTVTGCNVLGDSVTGCQVSGDSVTGCEVTGAIVTGLSVTGELLAGDTDTKVGDIV
eukprot:1324547-Amorphochlora_amoeboformis.AAC.1